MTRTPIIAGFPFNHTNFGEEGATYYPNVNLNQWYKYELFDKQLEHSRQVYSILDALGDYGGVEGVLIVLSALLLSPISTHSFYIKAI